MPDALVRANAGEATGADAAGQKSCVRDDSAAALHCLRPDKKKRTRLSVNLRWPPFHVPVCALFRQALTGAALSARHRQLRAGPLRLSRLQHPTDAVSPACRLVGVIGEFGCGVGQTRIVLVGNVTFDDNLKYWRNFLVSLTVRRCSCQPPWARNADGLVT